MWFSAQCGVLGGGTFLVTLPSGAQWRGQGVMRCDAGWGVESLALTVWGVFGRLCGAECEGPQGQSRRAFTASVDPNRMCMRGLVARILMGFRLQGGRLRFSAQCGVLGLPRWSPWRAVRSGVGKERGDAKAAGVDFLWRKSNLATVTG